MDLWQIAEYEGLHTVSVTESNNGYPTNVRTAITGFDSWEQAEDLAQQHGLQTVLLTQNFGWVLWYNRGWINEPPRIEPEDLGYNYILLNDFDEEEFTREFINLQEGCECNIEDIVEEAKAAQEVRDAAYYLEDDEAVFYGRNVAYDYEVVKLHPTAWEYDSRRYCVALI